MGEEWLGGWRGMVRRLGEEMVRRLGEEWLGGGMRYG